MQTSAPTSSTDAERRNTLGVAAMALAAVALIAAVVQLSVGPFAPQPEPIEKSITDTAVAIKDAAVRAMTGEAAPGEAAAPTPPTWDIDRTLETGTIALGGLAMLVAVAALFRGERQGPAFLGFTLGAGVLLLIFLKWVALLICGAIILGAIVLFAGDLIPS